MSTKEGFEDPEQQTSLFEQYSSSPQPGDEGGSQEFAPWADPVDVSARLNSPFIPLSAFPPFGGHTHSSSGDEDPDLRPAVGYQAILPLDTPSGDHHISPEMYDSSYRQPPPYEDSEPAPAIPPVVHGASSGPGVNTTYQPYQVLPHCHEGSFPESSSGAHFKSLASVPGRRPLAEAWKSSAASAKLSSLYSSAKGRLSNWATSARKWTGRAASGVASLAQSSFRSARDLWNDRSAVWHNARYFRARSTGLRGLNDSNLECGVWTGESFDPFWCGRASVPGRSPGDLTAMTR